MKLLPVRVPLLTGTLWEGGPGLPAPLNFFHISWNLDFYVKFSEFRLFENPRMIKPVTTQGRICSMSYSLLTGSEQPTAVST